MRVSNPFLHTLTLSRCQMVKIVFMSVTVAPLRICIILLTMLVIWFVSFVGTIGISNEALEHRPFVGWRRRLQGRDSPIVKHYS
jgi:hypothetical protein